MATHLISHEHGMTWQLTHAVAPQWFAPLGRSLFAMIFLLSSTLHFSPTMVEYAASQGVPFPSLLVPLSGIVALVGALSVMLGYKARYGAALLVLFLVPVTLVMHRFWSVPDAGAAMVERIMFMKNLSILGGALLLVARGAGPISFDARHEANDDSKSS